MDEDNTSNDVSTSEADDLFAGCGLRVELCDKPGSFLTIKETLTRMGVPSRGNVLSQSCHILHRRGQYAIVHFKEMFILNGRTSTFTKEDEARRDAIAYALQAWGLVRILDDPTTAAAERAASKFLVIKFGEKDKWKLNSKYTFSKRKPGEHNE